MSATILLADDSLTIQKVVELTFADTKYRVVAVSNGEELLERLGDTSPDLIICDVIMPGKDGYEVCEEIKSSPDWLHLPVILLTGTFEPFDRDRAVAAGCSEIITKPFEAQRLVETVERLLGPSAVEPVDEAEEFIAATETTEEAVDQGDLPAADVPPVETPGADDETDFGTEIAAAGARGVEDDELEFSTSGFAEMEASADVTDDVAEPGDEGLDFDLGGPQPEDLDDTTPSADPPAPPTEVPAETVKIELPAMTDESASPMKAEVLVAADEPSFITDELEDNAVGAVEESDATTGSFTEPGDEPFVEEVEDEAAEETAPEFRDESSMADTSPVDAPSDDVTTAPPPAGEVESLGLSDEDVDRIARRVLDLAADRLDQIAWEVLPDMAEIVVRQRVREIEEEAEAATADTVQ